MSPNEGQPDKARKGVWGPKAGDVQTILLYRRLVGERVYLYCLVRFAVVAAVAFGALLAKYVVGIAELDVPKLLGLALALALYNVIVLLILRPYRKEGGAEDGGTFLMGVMHGTIMMDFVFLTIALWLVGGAKSPFQAFYIFHVIVASTLLSRNAALAHAALGYAMLAGLVVGEWLGWIPPFYPPGAVSGGNGLDGRYVLTLLAVYGVLFLLSAIILTGLMQLLRAGERELHLANAELERSSEMRRDFLNIALHNMKSPVAAVAQQFYNIEAHLEGRLNEQEAHWMERCKTRLRQLGAFLGDLQVLTYLESDSIRKNAKSIDMKELLDEIVEANQDLAQLHQHTLTLKVPDKLPPVYGIRRLISEAIVNLVTNAIKYTPAGGTIEVRGTKHGDNVRVEVEDNGIGIAVEHQNLLFRDFGRIRRSDTNLGDTGSSGLGLSIVRRIIETHGGTVGVMSELNKWSIFIIELPVSDE